MKTEDDSLNEQAPAGSPKVHPTRDDMKLAAPRENLYPAWKQARCIWCKAGELFVGGTRFGIIHRLNAGPSAFRYVDCTAPSTEQYIAELEARLESERGTVHAIEEDNRSYCYQVEELRGRIASAEADSALLDWIETHHADIYHEGDHPELMPMERPWHVGVGECRYWRETLRAAIRAAIEADHRESGPASSTST